MGSSNTSSPNTDGLSLEEAEPFLSPINTFPTIEDQLPNQLTRLMFGPLPPKDCTSGSSSSNSSGVWTKTRVLGRRPTDFGRDGDCWECCGGIVFESTGGTTDDGVDDIVYFVRSVGYTTVKTTECRDREAVNYKLELASRDSSAR